MCGGVSNTVGEGDILMYSFVFEGRVGLNINCAIYFFGTICISFDVLLRNIFVKFPWKNLSTTLAIALVSLVFAKQRLVTMVTYIHCTVTLMFSDNLKGQYVGICVTLGQ